MKLLVLTQALDQDDPILGFFHGWILMLAQKVEHIRVLALRVGKTELPPNVSATTLRQGTKNRLSEALRLFGYIWSERRSYDAVFVHMNPEYILSAGWLLRLLGKPIYFWYNHPYGGARLWLASLFATKVFYTSPQAATATHPRARQMPVGINTDLFAPTHEPRDPYRIYMQGRVAQGKRVDLVLEAVAHLRGQLDQVHAVVVGPADERYLASLRTRFPDGWIYEGSQPNHLTPALYSRAAVALNLAKAGHFDKSALEAMACETPVIVGSETFRGLVDDEWIVDGSDARALAQVLSRFFALRDAERAALGKRLRAQVVEQHSLARLIDKLAAELV